MELALIFLSRFGHRYDAFDKLVLVTKNSTYALDSCAETEYGFFAAPCCIEDGDITFFVGSFQLFGGRLLVVVCF